MTKKILIGVFTLLLILSGCSSTYVQVNEEEMKSVLTSGINLLDNPGFESGTSESWGFSDSVFITSYQSHSGDYSAIINPVGGTEYFYNVVTADCNLDGALVISAWIRLASAWDADSVSFILERQLKGGRNDVYKVTPARTSDWQQVIIEAPALPAGSVQNLVVKGEVNSAQGSVLFDDFQVVSLDSESINYIRNGSFTNFGSNWGNYTHSYGRDGDGAVLDFSVPSVDLVQSTQWWNNSRPTFDANVDMMFSVFVSPAAASSGIVRLRVERKPELGSIYRDFTIKAGSGWQKLELPVEGISSSVDEAIFHIEVISGEGEIYIDDVSLNIVNLQSSSQSNSTVGVLSASQIAGTYLTNGNLESGDSKIASNWGLAPGWDQVPRSYWTNQEDAYSGKGAIFIQQYAGKEQVLLQADGWQDRSTTEIYDPSQPMMFSAYVKLDGITGDGVYLRVERKYDVNGIEQVLLSTSERVTGTTDGWIRLETYVESSELIFKEYLWDVVVSAGDGSLYVDDLVFEPFQGNVNEVPVASDAPSFGVNVLRNASMEELNTEGGTLHWDVWPGNPAEGVRDSEIITEGVYDGTQALKINLVFGNGQAVYQYCVMDTAGKFDFNQDYTFSCYLKLDDVMVLDGKGVTIGIKRRGEDGQEYNVYKRIEENSCDWTQFEVTANKVPVNIVQYDVIIDIGSGMGSVSIDACSLRLAEPVSETEDLVLTWE